MSDEIFDELSRWLASRRRSLFFEDDLLGLYAESLEESVFFAAQSSPPDCLTCGACCAYFHQILISLEDSTPRPLAWEVVDVDGQITHWLKRETRGARCVALAGTVGKRAECLIYELRPTACRAFEAGSDRCHALRRMYGLEPKLSAEERNRHSRALKENHREDAIDIAVPDRFDDESDQLKFLHEVITYNLEKLEAMIAEMTRLKHLFHTSGATRAAQHCGQALEITNNELVTLTRDFEQVKDAKPTEPLKRFLVIGNRSQAMLERATKRLAELGELAFEVLGMKSKFSED
jgi:Fe-S-cluster containining protein